MEITRRSMLLGLAAAGGLVAIESCYWPSPASATTPGAAFGVRKLADLAPLPFALSLPPIAARREGTTSATWDEPTSRAEFTYSGAGRTVTYIVDVASEALQAGMLEVTAVLNGASPLTVVSGAGVSYLTLAGAVLGPEQLAQQSETDIATSFDGTTLVIDYVERVEGADLPKRYVVALNGQSLEIGVRSDLVRGRGGYCAVNTGRLVSALPVEQHQVTFVEEVAVSMVAQSAFASAYLDKAKSGATRIATEPYVEGGQATHGMTAHYDLNSAGETNPLDETLYVTISDDLLGCVYLTSATKSAYRDRLNSRVIYDTWEYRPTYQERKRHYRELRQKWEMTDLTLIDHRWQRDTLDISTPAHYPASTSWGTAADFADYVATARSLGWMLVLHEDYWFMYPSATNQYWNVPDVSGKIAQNADGSYRYGWQTTSYANKSDEMVRYSQIESSQIKDSYHSDAAFLDVNGGVDPSYMNQVTLNADSTTSRTLAQVVADNVALFEGIKSIYQGPLMSEGAQAERSFGSAYAGHVEATEREITGTTRGPIMPDYELRHIRRLQANQGMGYPARFETTATRFRYEACASDSGAGMTNLPKMSNGRQGDNGLYYFAASGTGEATALSLMSRGSSATYGGEYWFHTDSGGRRSVIAPLMYPGIGVADPGASTYPVIGFRAPESGWMVARFSSTGYPQPGSDGFTMHMSLNGFADANLIPKGSGDEHWVKVMRGDMIYMAFRTNGATVAGDRCGYYAWLAYADIEEPERLVPVVDSRYTLSGSANPAGATSLPATSSGLQDDSGLRYFAGTGSESAVTLRPLRLAADPGLGGEHWTDFDGGSGVRIAPLAEANRGRATAHGNWYPVLAFRAPSAGTLRIDLEPGSGFVAQGSINGFASANLVDLTEETWVCVEQNDLVYIQLRPATSGDATATYSCEIEFVELSPARRRGTTHEHAAPAGADVVCLNELADVLPAGTSLQMKPGFDFNFDRYNAMSIAYGHAGFIGEIHHGMVEQQVNTYFMFRALQEQYLDTDADIDQLLYFALDGTSFNLDAAVRAGYDFTRSRLSVKYSNGLQLFLNFSTSDWSVTIGGVVRVLDPNGYAAVNPARGFTQFSCLLGGRRVDYVDSREYLYANPRGSEVDFGGGLVLSAPLVRFKSSQDEVHFETTVTPRTIGGKVYLYISVRNTDQGPIELSVTSPLGVKTLSHVNPGKSGSFALNSRQTSISAGVVSVTATSGERTTTRTVDFPAYP